MSPKHLLIFIAFLPISFYCPGQNAYHLSFQVSQLPECSYKLIFYYGDQVITRDSAISDSQGKVLFNLNDQDDPGMYRLEKDKKTGLDFLFNKENISIEAERNLGLDGLVVLESKENEVFFDYFRQKREMEGRIGVLSDFLKYYPQPDTFYNAASQHLARLQGIFSNYIDSVKTNFPGTLVTRIIQLDQLPEIRPGSLDPAAVERYRSEYFDGVDLKDSLILNSPLLPASVISYLSLYIEMGAPREVQEKNFMQAVDSLMKFTEGGPEVREMIVNYLIDGFQAYGFESVMAYLVENYVLGQKCVSDQQEEKLRKRVEGFSKLAIGSTVPDFELTDSQGKIFRLSDTGGKPTLLIFWSGNCPHCEAAMAEIKKLYLEFSGRIRFAGISVDEDEKIWRDAIQKNSLPWINLAELEGWNGKIIQDYYIYATPTFLVLDKDLKIIAKPAGMAELRKALAG